MRLLGIDYGTKRVGVAISDESQKLAFPHSVIPNTPSLIDDIDKIAKDNQSAGIVIGESRDYKMQANTILPGILDLKERLEGRGHETYLELEFMTSAQAEREQGKHAKIDASAAALILQSFLDKKAQAA